MKHFFTNHIYFGRMADRTDDEYIGNVSENLDVRPEAFRWFCGMHDLQSTFICQAL